MERVGCANGSDVRHEDPHNAVIWARLGKLIMKLCHGEASYGISAVVTGLIVFCSVSSEGFLML